jgi:uncharacterized protein YkwD
MMLPLGAAPATTTSRATAPRATTPATSEAGEAAALLRYQLALDQLALGNLAEARVIAEEARRRGGDTPEVNMLLGYLLQREGRDAEARERLSSVAATSGLAARFAAQIGTTAVPATARATGQAVSGTDTANIQYIAGTPTRIGQSDKSLAALEQTMLGMVNAERAKAGLGTLVWDANLADTARAHSVDMRDRNYFAHESPTTALRDPIDRYRAVFKATPAVVAENVYRSWGSPRRIGQAEVVAAHSSLMNSPGHRSNILMARVTRIGIGIITNSNGDIWVTQMFART